MQLQSATEQLKASHSRLQHELAQLEAFRKSRAQTRVNPHPSNSSVTQPASDAQVLSTQPVVQKMLTCLHVLRKRARTAAAAHELDRAEKAIHRYALSADPDDLNYAQCAIQAAERFTRS